MKILFVDVAEDLYTIGIGEHDANSFSFAPESENQVVEQRYFDSEEGLSNFDKNKIGRDAVEKEAASSGSQSVRYGFAYDGGRHNRFLPMSPEETEKFLLTKKW